MLLHDNKLPWSLCNIILLLYYMSLYWKYNDYMYWIIKVNSIDKTEDEQKKKERI